MAVVPNFRSAPAPNPPPIAPPPCSGWPPSASSGAKPHSAPSTAAWPSGSGSPRPSRRGEDRDPLRSIENFDPGHRGTCPISDFVINVESPEAPFTATITIHDTVTLLLDELTEVRAQLERVKRASVHLTLQVHEGFGVPLAVGRPHGRRRRAGAEGRMILRLTTLGRETFINTACAATASLACRRTRQHSTWDGQARLRSDRR